LATQFLQRSKVLALYRTILRGTKRIDDSGTRTETRKFARDEFERHRGVTDLVRPSSSLTSSFPKMSCDP
jgi:hypothetical protein